MAHTTKVTLPTPTFVLIKLYVKFIHPNVAYANSCIPTLRVASRSGSRFIQYERRLTKVRRPTTKGSRLPRVKKSQGRKTEMSPISLARPRPETDRDISTFLVQF